MTKQNLTDEELSEHISVLSNIISPSDTKDSIMILFGAFIGLVADDYPDEVKQYLSVLKQELQTLLGSGVKILSQPSNSV